jgi:hypothetical protein
LLNGRIESRRRNAFEKRGEEHLAQNVLGRRGAGRDPPFADRLLEFVER